MIDWAKQRVLVLCAHVDDEVLCGATIARIRALGGRVGVVALSPATESIPPGFSPAETVEEFSRSLAVLGAETVWRGDWPVRRLPQHRQDILERFVAIGRDFCPTVVITSSSTDMHQDHEVVHKESLRAFRNVPFLLGWESPNNERGTFEARIFVEVTEAHVNTKVAAWGQYVTQQHRASYTEDLIRGLAVVRGRQCRCETGLAEAFELLSMRL